MSLVLENMIGTLESTGDFRVLRRFDRPETYNEEDQSPTLLGVVVDVETTGLDAASCGLLEVAIVPFTFCRETGRIFRVLPAYSALHDPGMPIPEAVTLLTGITDDMVKGQGADPEAVQAIVKDAAIVIAHHAAFDRPVLERYFPIFATKAWACSCTQIDWRAEGYGTEKLELLAYKHRLWYVAHRADDDCRLVIELLSRTLPRSSKLALLALLQAARRPTWRIVAVDAP
ncbi:MAG: 3'-5' exonuclease, partial [Alphaproteobacteria bacterium]|nr:3'-5' exonuclease [Alphaproteobacteria bacterium]